MRDTILRVAGELDVPSALVADALGYLTAETEPGVAAQSAALEAAIGTGRDVPWQSDDERFQLLALLGAVPAARAWFAAQSIDDDIARDSLADLKPKLRDYGVEATGVDWLAKVVTCGVFTIGRLQFEPAASSPVGPAFTTHIPETGPLDPAECDASFARALAFFGARGDRSTRAFACSSWLLDDQLAAYLPAESNILSFQRRFTLVDSDDSDAPLDGATHGDHAVAKFIFRRPLAELFAVQPRSTLERAALAHLAAGRHWRERAGVLRLP
ncbi:acyltransferase domain-containing protein [Conyzicola sp.]|uniref:acyltransferase domain-containing protein n=1 Tax=Conyzicola sp. TaxID=1969404 RepID=UPI003988D3A9